MPNMSDKNFPHAHGAGRVVAAFQLSHPGADTWVVNAPYAPEAAEMQVLPAVLNNPALASLFPYPGSGGGGQWAIYRQPYNATSIGVFVQGSGTRRLPYTEALLDEVDAALSVPINAKLPSTDLYPFEIVDETKLGRTHAQVVCAAVGDGAPGCGGPAADITGAGQAAYYEIGLNWDIPDVSLTFSGLSLNNLNFANQKLASVQRALERTYWATASLSTNALAEFHPAVNYGPVNVDQMNALYGPLDGAVSNSLDPTFAAGPAAGGCASPYGWSPSPSSSVTVQPAYYPTDPSVDEAFRTRPYGLQTQVSAIVKSTKVEVDGAAFRYTLKLAPIVRVWIMLPASPLAGSPDPFWAPRPLPRVGIGAYQYNPEFLGPSMIPGVNVQVIQKNTSAIDNTDLGIYDLGSAWSDIQNPGSPVLRSSAPKTAEDSRLSDIRMAAKREEKD